MIYTVSLALRIRNEDSSVGVVLEYKIPGPIDIHRIDSSAYDMTHFSSSSSSSG